MADLRVQDKVGTDAGLAASQRWSPPGEGSVKLTMDKGRMEGWVHRLER